MVLIVDDDEDVREALRDLVSGEGYRVEEARDGQEALAVLASATEQPCLILLDLVMPVMNGWQFLETVRSSGRLSVPVVVVSAHADSHAPAGASGLLIKPFDARELLRTVARTCGPPA